MLPLIFYMEVLWHCSEAQMKVFSHDFLECSWYKNKSQQVNPRQTSAGWKDKRNV